MRIHNIHEAIICVTTENKYFLYSCRIILIFNFFKTQQTMSYYICIFVFSLSHLNHIQFSFLFCIRKFYNNRIIENRSIVKKIYIKRMKNISKFRTHKIISYHFIDLNFVMFFSLEKQTLRCKYYKCYKASPM